MKVAVPLAKKLSPFGITAAALAIDAGIQKKTHDSGVLLIISNEEMSDIIKIVQALQDSNISLKGVSERIENETKEQKGGFLGMLLGTLGASLLGNSLTGRGIVRAGYGKKKKNSKSRLWNKSGFLMSSYPLTRFEIQKYYQNEPRFNGVYSRDNLPKKVKDGAYITTLDEYADVGRHWIALFFRKNSLFQRFLC